MSRRRARQIEPLMGWTASTDMRSQVSLEFDTLDEAIAYAQKNGIPYQVFEPHKPVAKAESLFGQFPLRPEDSLDALTSEEETGTGTLLQCLMS